MPSAWLQSFDNTLLHARCSQQNSLGLSGGTHTGQMSQVVEEFVA